MLECNEIKYYRTKRNSKEFNSLLKGLLFHKIAFTECEDNGIFERNGVRHPFAKRMLYRWSGMSRMWKTTGKSEDFVPMSDDEYFNRYIKTMLFKLFKIES